MKSYFALFLWVVIIGWKPATVVEEPVKEKQPINIILLIGDGMGLSQMSSAFYFGEGKPNFVRFPYCGLSITSASSDKITDSAAGATALSTGKKSYNGAIGVDADTASVETLVEYFARQGKSCGLIATSSITHATPASFYAHIDSRHQEPASARAIVNAPLQYFAGGGQRFILDGKTNVLLKQLAEQGWNIALDGLKSEKDMDRNKRHGFLLAEDGMPTMLHGRGEFLKNATQLGIEFLSEDEDGFFMMIEGSQIDWAGHANEAGYLIAEVLDFDQTVGAVLDFAEKDGNTLVIVTADHETGGFSLSSEQKKVPFQGMQSDYNSIKPTFSTGGHSAALVPVLAYGPGAEKFSGVYPNTYIHELIVQLTEKLE